MPNTQQDIQDKVKIRVLNTPINMQGEIVFDFRNTNSITVSVYPKFRTVDISEWLKVVGNIETTNGVYKVAGTQVLGAQQPAIVGVSATGGDSDAVARGKLNEIIVMLRNHGIIAT